MIKRISHMNLWVKDQNEALLFYTEILGFDIRVDIVEGDFRWLTIGLKEQPDLDFGLSTLKPGGFLNEDDVQVLRKLLDEGKLGGYILKTDDIYNTYEDWKAKGVEFLISPMDRPYGVIEAMFRDNSGNWLLLQQDK